MFASSPQALHHTSATAKSGVCEVPSFAVAMRTKSTNQTDPTTVAKKRQIASPQQEDLENMTQESVKLTSRKRKEFGDSSGSIKRRKQQKGLPEKVLHVAKGEEVGRIPDEQQQHREGEDSEKSLNRTQQREKAFGEQNWEDEREMQKVQSKKREREEAEHYNRKEVRSKQKKVIMKEAARRSMSGTSNEYGCSCTTGKSGCSRCFRIELGPTSSSDSDRVSGMGLAGTDASPVKNKEEGEKEHAVMVERTDVQSKAREDDVAQRPKRQRRRARGADRKRDAGKAKGEA